MTDSVPELTRRNQHIFAEIVKNYLESGSPVGSGLIAAHPDIDLSSASVRAIMADLEQTGLLFSPDPSAGRIPTRAGLRLFVDGLMEVGGAIGVIGPRHMNYAKIISMVDYTSETIARLLR